MQQNTAVEVHQNHAGYAALLPPSQTCGRLGWARREKGEGGGRVVFAKSPPARDDGDMVHGVYFWNALHWA